MTTLLPLTIGVTGKKRHGKDTVGDWLVKNRGYTRMALADELKAMVLDLDPLVDIPDENAIGTDLDPSTVYRLSVLVERFGMDAVKNIPEVRRLLQVFGTEVIRARDENWWVNTLDWNIEAARAASPFEFRVVIPDIRYDNEARWVRAKGGLVIHVHRPGVDDGDTHASEAGVSDDLIDLSVSNDGEVEELHAVLDSLL